VSPPPPWACWRKAPTSTRTTNDAIHAGDGQQPSELLVLDHGFAQQPIDRRKVLAAEPIDFAQALLHRKTLIHWKRLLIQPDAPFAPEQIACRT